VVVRICKTNSAINDKETKRARDKGDSYTFVGWAIISYRAIRERNVNSSEKLLISVDLTFVIAEHRINGDSSKDLLHEVVEAFHDLNVAVVCRLPDAV
jgi:hypothetical protein